jgi:hypothetical protein
VIKSFVYLNISVDIISCLCEHKIASIIGFEILDINLI